MSDQATPAVLYSALSIAIDATQKQLSFKKQDLFRNHALKLQLGQFEAERARLAMEFPYLVDGANS
jgi:hypothetical protein